MTKPQQDAQLSLLDQPNTPVEGLKYNGRSIIKEGKTYFPVVDIIADLTESKDPKGYWFDMQRRETTQLSAICRKFYVLHQNGREYNTDCVDIEGAFRLIQSIPSPKAEPIKLALAKMAAERVEEMANPELGITRARVRAVKNWQRQGRTDAWIEERMKGIDKRNTFTDTMKAMGAKSPKEYALGTAKAHAASFGLLPSAHKDLKHLKERDNLRDNMVSSELTMQSFSDQFFTEMAKTASETGKTLKDIQEAHATMMREIRERVERETGRKLATPETPRKQLIKS